MRSIKTSVVGGGGKAQNSYQLPSMRESEMIVWHWNHQLRGGRGVEVSFGKLPAIKNARKCSWMVVQGRQMMDCGSKKVHIGLEKKPLWKDTQS